MTVKNSKDEQHNEKISVMSQYFDDGKPQVGIFGYDYEHNDTIIPQGRIFVCLNFVASI